MVALVEGVVKEMLWSRIRAVVGVLVGLALLGGGAGLLAGGRQAPPPTPRQSVGTAPVPSGKEPGRDKPKTLVRPFDRELFTLRGPGAVTALGFAPDGKLLASGHGWNVVLWDLATRKEVQRWQAPSDWGAVRSVAVAPDNSAVAVAGRSGPSGRGDKGFAALVFDVRTGKVRHRLGHPQEACACVAFSPDGKKLAFAGHRFLLFDVVTGRLLWHAHAPRTPIPGKPLYQTKTLNLTGVAFAPDGQRLATISVFNVLTLWTVDGKEIVELPGGGAGTAPRDCFAFAPDGKTLAWRQPDRSVFLLDGHTGKKLRTLACAPSCPGPDPRGLESLHGRLLRRRRRSGGGRMGRQGQSDRCV